MTLHFEDNCRFGTLKCLCGRKDRVFALFDFESHWNISVGPVQLWDVLLEIRVVKRALSPNHACLFLGPGYLKVGESDPQSVICSLSLGLENAWHCKIMCKHELMF